MHLKLNRLAEIEVVTPLRIKNSDVEAFVNQNLDWINRQRNKILSQHSLDKNLSLSPPSEIFLPLIDAKFSVNYSATDEPFVNKASFSNKKPFTNKEPLANKELNKKKRKLSVDGSIIGINAQCDVEIRKQLQKFIHSTAKTELLLRLNAISDEFELPYNRLFIKAQKTRWGSCSSKKNINLNRNLLFLKPNQVDYLIVHELCHTVHLNHSSRYWQLVSEFVPDYKNVDKSLRNATLNVPLWALA